MKDYVTEARQVMGRYKKAAVELNDSNAVTVPELYDLWNGNGVSYVAGDRKRYNQTLYKCVQAHTSQESWTPEATPALWNVIDVEHTGTIEDPIPAKRNMVYFKDKYYMEDGTIYLCTRDSGIALAYLPSELINQYFTVAEQNELKSI